MVKQLVPPLHVQCQKVIDNPGNYAILDTETTGLHGECIDLAVIDPTGAVLFNELLRPQCPIEEEAMAIHGISEAMVATARTFAEEWPRIQRALDGRAIIVYNASFDSKRIKYTAKVHGVTLPDMTWRCFMLKYADFYGEPNRYGYSSPAWQKLEAACRQQRIDFVQDHRALGDALATVALIRRLADLGDGAARWNSEILG
jgi:DNA polymerase III subunit epsilon